MKKIILILPVLLTLFCAPAKTIFVEGENKLNSIKKELDENDCKVIYVNESYHGNLYEIRYWCREK